MLLLPKFWAFLVTVGQPVKLHYLGGGPKLIAGIFIETLVSIVIAPIQMLFHSTFVIGTLLGHRVQWNAQNRNESGISWAQAAEAHASHTIFGLGMTVLLDLYIPALLPWALPVLFGMIISIPMSIFLSSQRVGQFLRRWQLLQIPEESNMPEILKRQHEYLEQFDDSKPIAMSGKIGQRSIFRCNCMYTNPIKNSCMLSTACQCGAGLKTHQRACNGLTSGAQISQYNARILNGIRIGMLCSIMNAF
ncbi:MAG: hypothetical protein ACF8OB_08245 [Phycisphaeraceae bacterium JB051]